MFFELLELFKWTFVAAVLSATALAWIGGHLAARDQSLQVLCVGQGAQLGAILSLGLFGEIVGLGSVVAFLVSAGVYFFAERMTRRVRAARNTYLAGFFAVLLAASYALSALFPALESHMVQVFFGDLATLSASGAWITMAWAGLALALLFRFRRGIADQSFVMSVLGQKNALGLFFWLSLVSVCLSVQYLGFLFTMTFLFLPTLWARWAGFVGLNRHWGVVLTVAALGALGGLAASLGWSQLPTVPAVALATCVLGVFAGLVRKTFNLK